MSSSSSAWPSPPSRPSLLFKMHPQLDLHKHPHCQDVIKTFKACHADHPVGRYFNYCRQARKALDECLQQEYEIWSKEKHEEHVQMKVKGRKILNPDGSYRFVRPDGKED